MLENIEIQEHPLRPLVKKYHIKLAKVALFCGVSYHHVSHILSGNVKPGRKTKRKLDKLYQHLLKKEQESHEN